MRSTAMVQINRSLLLLLGLSPDQLESLEDSNQQPSDGYAVALRMWISTYTHKR